MSPQALNLGSSLHLLIADGSLGATFGPSPETGRLRKDSNSRGKLSRAKLKNATGRAGTYCGMPVPNEAPGGVSLTTGGVSRTTVRHDTRDQNGPWACRRVPPSGRKTMVQRRTLLHIFVRNRRGCYVVEIPQSILRRVDSGCVVSRAPHALIRGRLQASTRRVYRTTKRVLRTCGPTPQSISASWDIVPTVVR